MSKSLKVYVSLTKKADGSNVFYKIDGERFRDNKTVKFHTDTGYNILVETTPGLGISDVCMSGVKIEGTSKENDENKCHYSGVWSTSILPKTSNKDRTVIPVSIAFDDGSTVEISLQSKIYPIKEKTHVVWGTPLQKIELKCSKKDNDKFVHVDNIAFL